MYRFFVKTGSSWTWYESPTVNTNSKSASTLTLSLSGVANLGDVREIGILNMSPTNSSGGTSV
ncbi:hypothetical protein [Paenibacillus harenae]|uniref:Mannanase galactose-binding domain-containing protein n=1 Tax=Paenibacillus harenae TaxID=306543 RepID=A0ABT9U304_PAEHA|nr:hypothetical protein [Paenibacillus harenae]MDQ0112674.1 hypothetical protein [Paenibacillus harenae]